MIEAAPSPPSSVERDWEDGIWSQFVHKWLERLGHVRRELADAAELETVDDAPRRSGHLEGGAGARERLPGVAGRAVPLAHPPGPAVRAAPRTAAGTSPEAQVTQRGWPNAPQATQRGG